MYKGKRIRMSMISSTALIYNMDLGVSGTRRQSQGFYFHFLFFFSLLRHHLPSSSFLLYPISLRIYIFCRPWWQGHVFVSSLIKKKKSIHVLPKA